MYFSAALPITLFFGLRFFCDWEDLLFPQRGILKDHNKWSSGPPE
jgi:hypothetical protein